MDFMRKKIKKNKLHFNFSSILMLLFVSIKKHWAVFFDYIGDEEQCHHLVHIWNLEKTLKQTIMASLDHDRPNVYRSPCGKRAVLVYGSKAR